MSDLGRPIVQDTLGEVPESVTDPALRDLLQALIMQADLGAGRQGGGTNGRYVTVQDLVNAGLVPDGKIPG